MKLRADAAAACHCDARVPAHLPCGLAAARRRGALGRVRRPAARTPPSSIAPAGRQVIERRFRSPHPLPRRRSGDASIVGVLPLAEVQEPAVRHIRWCRCRSASTAASLRRTPTRSPALHARGAASWPTQLGVDHLELRNRDGPRAGLAAPGPLRHLPQGDPARGRGQHAGHSAQAARDGAQGHQERAARARSTTMSTGSSRCMPTTCIGTARRRCRSAIFEAAARVSGRLRGADGARRRTERPVSSVLIVLLPRRGAALLRRRRRSRRATWPPTTSSTGS